MDPTRRATRALALTFTAYALLVAMNLGEFWPFSIYPMFSQGGNPWSRAVVREVDHDVVEWLLPNDAPADDFDDSDEPAAKQRSGYAANFWRARGADQLPGEGFALLEHGADAIDVANFVSKTRIWDDARVQGLRDVFGRRTLEEKTLVVMRADGRLVGDDTVTVTFTPYAVLAADTTLIHPDLPRTESKD